ncbi:metal-dependent hydrolase family protein [Govanella unica]|uniref:Amidohydrolase family protein n=1 Tax=Govanella unica TaxID=2975056 RepID=A0A9X3Z6Y2_9PROT|nr:amidohydrolase family protein [Govania unica]MDA5193665.1 amidohydrolase family protein [Govania unica]
MKKYLLGISALALMAFGNATAADWTLIQAGHVIADPREAALGATTIVVKDDRILRLVPGRSGAEILTEKADGDQVKIVDLSSSTVLPGLIDSHVHLAMEPDDPFWQEVTKTESDATVQAIVNAEISLKAGFTTVRDLMSGPDSVFAVRDAINRGEIVGPRILAAGPGISILGGHGDSNGFRRDVYKVLAENTVRGVCTGVDDCARAVREASKFGADVIKITATGGVTSQQGRGLDLHFSPAELKSIVDTAHLLGLKVASHAHGPRGIEAASAAGVDTIEHGTFADDAGLKVMKKQGTYFVPTLLAFNGVKARLGKGIYTPVVEKKVRETLQKVGLTVKSAKAMGIPIAFGTDAGVFEHGINAQEFKLLVDYGGLTPREALVSATVTAAKALGLENEIGTLSVGKSADIIAVDGDPLTSPEVLEKVGFVMARGKIVSKTN